MPVNEPIRPLLPTPPTVLITGAFHLPMTWLLLTALGADRWGPLGAVEQCDPIEERHLTQLLDVYSHLFLYFYLNLNRFTVGAPSLLVLPVPTEGAFPRLFGFVLMRLMSPLPAAETPDLAQVTIHEDRHFCWSSGAWDERCRFRGRVYRGREGPLQLILDQVVEVGMFDAILGSDQVLLDDEILLVISSSQCCASLCSLSRVSLSSIFPLRRLTSPTMRGSAMSAITSLMRNSCGAPRRNSLHCSVVMAV